MSPENAPRSAWSCVARDLPDFGAADILRPAFGFTSISSTVIPNGRTTMPWPAITVSAPCWTLIVKIPLRRHSSK